MTAIRTQPTIIVKGDQLDLPFTYRVKGGAGINMTGWTVVATLGVAGAVEMAWVDQPAGRFKITIQETKSAQLPENEVSKLVIKFTDSLGDIRTPAILWMKAIVE